MPRALPRPPAPALVIADCLRVAGKLKLKPFTEADWSLFPGAEKFDDNTDPQMGELAVSDWDPQDLGWQANDFGADQPTVLIIRDNAGVQIHGGDTWLGFETKDTDAQWVRLKLLADVFPVWSWSRLHQLRWDHA